MVIDSDPSNAYGRYSIFLAVWHRYETAYLTRFAKTNDIAIIMVGHVTKDGTLAGPKVLEHCIDCSVMLDGETDSRFRTLRSHKNRFGAVNELGVLP